MLRASRADSEGQSRPGRRDPDETADWLAALESLFRPCRRRSAPNSSCRRSTARRGSSGSIADRAPFSPYRNTIPLEQQRRFPGDLAIEERITAIMRWNALAMVVRANKAYGELGGHIASYASAAEIFEVGFNHFFRAAADGDGGDLVFFQPHSAPGVYARAFLEGRLGEEHLEHYRQEIGGGGPAAPIRIPG